MTREEKAIIILQNEQPHCGGKITFTEEERYEAYSIAIQALEQESKTGHWTDDGYCSCCNKQTLPLDISGYASGYDSFCPNCGAKMESE